MTFDEAFERLIGHEGGYVSPEKAKRDNDPGGETNFGISKRSYPNEDIAALTLDRAKAIYLRDFWTPAGCERVPEGIRFDLFDMAVNSGVRAAVRCVQASCGETQDGILGPRTIAAIAALHPAVLAMRFNGHRLHFMTTLANWPDASRGWARRIAKNLTEA
jgi:lysozyme family protein